MTTTITGKAVVLVSKYTSFDLECPEKTEAHKFMFHHEQVLKDGVLDPSWAGDGYRHVGFAELTVNILPRQDMLHAAVGALKAEKQNVIATAEREATRIESEIQKLLAISYDAA